MTAPANPNPTAKVLVFAPHPDDAEYYAGGTLAKMIQEGARVTIVTVTDGSCGSQKIGRQGLILLRREEAMRACQALGAEPPILLNYPDLELDQLPPGVLRKQFVHLIRQHQPDIVVAQDAFYNWEVHPDHRTVALAVSDAVNYAMLPLFHPEHLAEGLSAHFVKEKYYYTDRLEQANKIVDVSQTMSIRLKALAEHHSQMAFLVEDVLKQARLAGVDLSYIPAEILADPATAVGWALQMEAAEIGKQIGVQDGEAFRYTRFHPMVENLITLQSGGAA